MMKKQEITKKKLRTFGMALALFLAIIGTVHFFKGNVPTNYWFWGTALLIFATSVTLPVLIKPVYQAAMFVAHILGWINTRLILGLIYYLLFTPVGVIMRVLGKDPLHRKFDKQAKTYWKVRDRTARPKEHYLRQF